ncbi:(deoxy)nucleoside triphosphate pyrophosphohydrolase [Blastomonas sp. AAP53]|uniref:(deoxy)nucleoside triphosphate pyrophosphohydrolase n=1 Tax=Blastomonas sp. AAP53 TaxID=1248760 RepID=UPI00058E8050|nr:(deoxy)nucleoside triphosphate pyrophosphohydrolase [Blastomonas sp. AAP53]
MENSPTLFPVVAALLCDSRGRVLVQQRPEGTAMAGLWEFPGGKIEPGESPEIALARELAEELGIAVDPADCVPMTFASAPLGGKHLVLLLFRCVAWQGEPQALHATALQWASVEELYALPMPSADLPLLAIIQQMQGAGPTPAGTVEGTCI